MPYTRSQPFSQSSTPSYSQRRALLETAGAAGRRWRAYAALLTAAAAAIAVVALFPDLPLRQGGAGLVLGALGILLIAGMVGITTPDTDGRLAGQSSVAGLRSMRGWHVVDTLPFEREDVDHVVVAPTAVLAVATAHHSHATSGTAAARHRRDLATAERAARRVRTLLRSTGVHDAVVVPVLVVRGPGAPELPGGHRVDDGVHVVDGDHPARWLHLFDTPRLSVATRRELYRGLADHALGRALQEHGTLPSVHREMWRKFRGGIAHERATRTARHERAREVRRGHGVRSAPAPAASASTIAAVSATPEAAAGA